MDSLDAENYCEAIAIYSRKISEKVKSVRYKNAVKQSKTFEYRDPTANQSVDNNSEIRIVEVVINGERFNLGFPERWLKVLEHTHKKFGERFGDEYALTAKYRYKNGWDPTKVYVYQGISRRTFGARRSEFLKMLVVYAVQARLISID